MLGTIGEYIWRISSEVRGQPQYLVMQEVGLDSRIEPANQPLAGAHKED
jgi:hypothetical protein